MREQIAQPTARLDELGRPAEEVRITRKRLLQLPGPQPPAPPTPKLPGYPDYQQIMAVCAVADAPLRRGRCEAMDLDIAPNNFNDTRLKLKRLTDRGILVETGQYLFSQPQPPGGPRPARSPLPKRNQPTYRPRRAVDPPLPPLLPLVHDLRRARLRIHGVQRLDQALLPQIAVSAVRQGVGVQFATDPLRRPAGATSAEQARGPADAILEGAQRRPATPRWRMGRHCRTLPRRPAHGDHPGDLAPRRSHRTQTPCRNRSGTPQAHPLGSRRERSRIQYAEAQRVRHFEAQEAAWRHATRPTQHLSAVRTIAPAMPPGQTRTRVAGRGFVVLSQTPL